MASDGVWALGRGGPTPSPCDGVVERDEAGGTGSAGVRLAWSRLAWALRIRSRFRLVTVYCKSTGGGEGGGK